MLETAAGMSSPAAGADPGCRCDGFRGVVLEASLIYSSGPKRQDAIQYSQRNGEDPCGDRDIDKHMHTNRPLPRQADGTQELPSSLARITSSRVDPSASRSHRGIERIIPIPIT